MIINHVMSQDVESKIFNSFIDYLGQGRQSHTHVSSIAPIENADVWHYHRPHLENVLKPNSVVTVHHDLRDTDSSLELNRFLGVYAQAKTVVCLNSHQEEYLHTLGIDHTAVIPHGYNDEVLSLTPKTRTNNKKIRLGFVSKRYGRRVKGEALLIELAKRINKEDFCFTLVGEGRSEEHRALTDLGFEVRTFESLPYRLFNQLYSEMDALLMLSHYEGGPANIPEAVSTGTPVIALNVGMVRDLILHNENGLILSGNADLDALSLNNLIKNPSELPRLSKGARRLSSTAMSWNKVSNQYTKIYEATVRSKS